MKPAYSEFAIRGLRKRTGLAIAVPLRWPRCGFRGARPRSRTRPDADRQRRLPGGPLSAAGAEFRRRRTGPVVPLAGEQAGQVVQRRITLQITSRDQVLVDGDAIELAGLQAALARRQPSMRGDGSRRRADPRGRSRRIGWRRSPRRQDLPRRGRPELSPSRRCK